MCTGWGGLCLVCIFDFVASVDALFAVIVLFGFVRFGLFSVCNGIAGLLLNWVLL